MIKRLLLSILALLALGSASLLLFGERITELAMTKLTEDMFVAEDADAFDPGLPVGASLPTLRAQYATQEVVELEQFMGERGLLLFANRSVEW